MLAMTNGRLKMIGRYGSFWADEARGKRGPGQNGFAAVLPKGRAVLRSLLQHLMMREK